MRLTLRTLLAWLDGVLPDDEQQDLGRKVSSSVVATHLVERIRAAVGRPAVGAPKPDGRGLTEDPNSVAEYLDNTLSSDQLEAFERICIESELHLAEVAACHGILAQVARDHSVEHGLHGDERERIQQRLRGLLAGLQDRAATEQAAMKIRGDGHRESRETAWAIRDAMAASAGVRTATAVSGNGVVDPQRHSSQPAKARSSLAAWAAAVVAIALLLTLAGVLVWSIAGRGGRRLSEVALAQPQPQEQPVEPAPPAPDAPAAGKVETAASQNAAVVMPVETQPPHDTEPDAGKANTTDPTEKVAMPAEAAAPTVPAAPAPAAMPASQTPAVAPVNVSTRAVEAAVEPQDPVGFVGGEGVLLRLAETPGAAGAATEWTFFPVGSPLGKREDLLVPPTFQPELHVRGVTIRLLPETRAVLSMDGDGTPRIEVVFGRAVARASRADSRLGVTAAGLVGIIDAGLLSPVAIEVELERFPGADPANTPPVVRSRIYAASSGLAWRQTTAGGLPSERPLDGIDVQGLLDAGVSLEWNSIAADRAALTRGRTLPNWIESGARPARIEKSAGESLAAKVAVTTPLARALRELAADKRAENRMLAAATLALMGDFDDLVEQLSAESPGRKLEQRQWSQFQNATVPLAMARGGNAASRLYESLVNRGPHGKADALWAMARGFTDEELAAGVDRALVEALDDPSLIVRRYASKALIDITQPSAADRTRYRADGQPDMRREGVVWWRNQLDKGLIRRGAIASGNTARNAGEPAMPAMPAEESAEGPAEEPAEE
jgi:hypothetical protein